MEGLYRKVCSPFFSFRFVYEKIDSFIYRPRVSRASAEEKIWLHIKSNANAHLAKLVEAQSSTSSPPSSSSGTPSRRSARNKKKQPPEEWFPVLLDALDDRWKESAERARGIVKMDEKEVVDGAVREVLKGVEAIVSVRCLLSFGSSRGWEINS